MEATSLAGSRKLQEDVWEWGRALAPGMSLRLEVTLLAACLRGQRPESESLSWLCPLSMWIKARLVTMRFLKTQIGNCRIWSNWKCKGLLPLVALALSGPEKDLQWLLFQLLRYSFCTICWTRIERLNLIPHERFYPRRLALHHLLCYHIDSGDNSQKGHLGISDHPFMTYCFYYGQ